MRGSTMSIYLDWYGWERLEVWITISISVELGAYEEKFFLALVKVLKKTNISTKKKTKAFLRRKDWKLSQIKENNQDG